MVERDGKFQVPAMVWALVFGFATGESQTLAAFRRSYNATADKTLSPGGFYQRLTPLFAAYLSDLVEFALDEVAVPHTVSDEFDQFRDVMIADATVLRLHRFLKSSTKDDARSRLERSSTCSTTSLTEPSRKSELPANVLTTAPSSRLGRGSVDGC